MSYRELRYYRSYPLELRECGDCGWAVHVYTPRREGRSEKIAVVSSPLAADLQDVMRQAKAAVETDYQQNCSRLS